MKTLEPINYTHKKSHPSVSFVICACLYGPSCVCVMHSPVLNHFPTRSESFVLHPTYCLSVTEC